MPTRLPVPVPPSRSGRRAAVTVGVLGLVLLACSSPEAAPSGPAVPAGPSTAVAEVVGNAVDLAPGATLSPTILAEVPISSGLNLVLVTSGPTADVVKRTAQQWAETNGAALQHLSGESVDLDLELRGAIDAGPDLVVVAGPEIVDVVGFVSPQYLSQHFLALGGQLAEPTTNVSAVIWPGGAARGAGIDPTAGQDDTTFTQERVTEALDAGVRLFLDGSDGYVIELS